MAILPSRRRKSGPQRALETVQSALKVYTSLKVAQAGPKAAKAVAKGYAGAKTAKGVSKLAPLLAIPILGGMLFALLRRRKSSQDQQSYSTSPATGHVPPGTPGSP